MSAIENNKPAAFSRLSGDKNIDLLIIKNVDCVQAYLNQCPHQGRRLDYAPGQFLCKDGRIICAAHGATFEQSTGLCVQGPCRGESLIKLDAVLVGEQLRVDISRIA